MVLDLRLWRIHKWLELSQTGSWMLCSQLILYLCITIRAAGCAAEAWECQTDSFLWGNPRYEHRLAELPEAALWWRTWSSDGGKADVSSSVCLLFYNSLLCHQFEGLVTLQEKVLLWKINFSCEYLGSCQVPWMWFCRLLTVVVIQSCSSLVWSLLSCISEQTLALSRICAVESLMKGIWRESGAQESWLLSKDHFL